MNVRLSLLLVALASGVGASAAANAQQEAPETVSARPEPRATALGTRSQQFFLAKIIVSDLHRSYEFYTEVIGLKWATPPNQPPPAAPSPEDPPVDFQEIPLNFSGSLADPIFVLVKRRGIEPAPQTARLTTIGFKVPSVSDALARATAAGHEIVSRPPGDGPLTFGFVSDPDGYTVELIEAPSYGEDD